MTAEHKATPLEIEMFKDMAKKYMEDAFEQMYKRADGTEYHMKVRYGKYSIYKWDFKDGVRSSTTLAKKVDRDLAVGMMKLLKEPT
jgi:hypothetical protein